jgi:hypothetical protein
VILVLHHSIELVMNELGGEGPDTCGKMPGPSYPNNIHISNLPFGFSLSCLLRIASAYGIVKACRVGISSFTRVAFGLVSYSKEREAQRALQCMNGSYLAGRRLGATWALKAKRKPRPLTNVYFDKLPRWWTTQELRTLCGQQFGKIVGARVIWDQDAQEGRGYGFVRFDTNENAKKAIARLDGSILTDSGGGGRAQLAQIAVRFARAPAWERCGEPAQSAAFTTTFSPRVRSLPPPPPLPHYASAPFLHFWMPSPYFVHK